MGAAGAGRRRPAVGGPHETRPNVLWICTDQQRWDTIRSLGNEHIRTPSIDRLVASGVAFENAYCQSPICTPSRAGFMTGMYRVRSSRVHERQPALGRRRAAGQQRPSRTPGYDCALAGKFHLSGAQGRIEPRLDDGYRVCSIGATIPHDDWPEGHAYSRLAEIPGKGLRLDLQEARLHAERVLHQTTWCADRAIDFIQRGALPALALQPELLRSRTRRSILRRSGWTITRKSDMPGPLFRESDLEAQHRLRNVNFQRTARRPEEMNAKSYQARYYAMVELIDHNVGRMLDCSGGTPASSRAPSSYSRATTARPWATTACC